MNLPRHGISNREHFAHAQPEAAGLLGHVFDQLEADLEWALDAAHTFRDRDGREPGDAAIIGIRAIAGRRYHRYKVAAEEEDDGQRAEEMQRFAQFWYHLADKLEDLGISHGEHK